METTKIIVSVVIAGIAIFIISLVMKFRKSGSEDKEQNFMGEGIGAGLALGAALGQTAFNGNMGLGIAVGMILGTVIGMNIKKKK